MICRVIRLNKLQLSFGRMSMACNNIVLKEMCILVQGPAVQKLDSAIHRIVIFWNV